MKTKHFKQFFNFTTDEDKDVQVVCTDNKYEVIGINESKETNKIEIGIETKYTIKKPVGLHLFHRWSKWETIENEVKWKVIQERECTICGKKQVRREKIKERKR